MRVFANKNVPLIECINKKYNKYKVRFDIAVEDDDMISFYEVMFDHKPTINDIKSAIISHYNKIIDDNIVNGFVWKDMLIQLTLENQFNYKAAYDLAVQTNGATLPVTFKFGDSINPIYYTFKDLNDINDLYISSINHIQKCLSEGWNVKDNIDWSLYNL
jgi:hypothetical protein